ncbi:MAG: hypothetical protein B9S33_00545 [Pedosphaera sp. Tous-C6FEB]|nr:MAG: hypothetical protein B9S33_00545 [Pedosphaera sp. Tous-C6FEB]
MELLADHLAAPRPPSPGTAPAPAAASRLRSAATRRSSLGWLAACALWVFSVAATSTGLAAPAQPQNEAEVKADYLFLFTKYVEWPAGVLASNQPIVIGVIGDEAVRDALARRVEGRFTQGGRKVTIRRAQQPADFADCHVLFVGQGERRIWADLAKSLRDKPVLTVCDTEARFTQDLMIKFGLMQGSVRFEVKLEPVERVGLSIQSGMLASATRVWRKSSSRLESP